MRARVLFFGMLKELVGRSADDAEFPEGTDLRAVFESYALRYPPLREMARSIVMARNREFAELSTKLAEGDEVAFLPPVSGGASAAGTLEAFENGNYFALTRQAIDPRAAIARIQTDRGSGIGISHAADRVRNERLEQRRGDIVDTVKVDVLEHVQGDALAGARQPAHDDKSHRHAGAPC